MKAYQVKNSSGTVIGVYDKEVLNVLQTYGLMRSDNKITEVDI